MLGMAWDRENLTGRITIPAAGFVGNNIDAPFKIPFFFGKYEHNRVMFGAEYSRVPTNHKSVFTAGPSGVQHVVIDHREWHAMSSYKLRGKLTGGLYYSSFFNKSPHRGQRVIKRTGRFPGAMTFLPSCI